MISDAAQIELANEFASLTPEALTARYQALTDTIYCARAGTIAHHALSLKDAVDEVLPHLAEMQAFLSQRGHARKQYRKAKLPTWGKWFTSFKNYAGLTVSLRSIQKKIANLRGHKQREKPDPPVKLSAKNQRRLLTVHQYANEIVAAVENSANWSEVVREYKKVAMDSVRIGQLLESAGTEDDAVEQPPAPVPVVAAENVKAVISPKAVWYKSPKTESVSLPKPGDCSGLVSNISQLCGDHLKAGLEGLEPEVMANVYGKVVQRLAQMYCVDASGSAVELTVTVQKITRKAPMSCEEVRQDWRFAT